MDDTKLAQPAEAAPVTVGRATVARATQPPARRQRAATQPATASKLAISKLRAAREAVQDFLVTEFQAREVRITKIGPSAGDPPGWYAEAEIMVPDFAIMSLGLPLSQEVLERELCAIELDDEMTVKSCEVCDPRDR